MLYSHFVPNLTIGPPVISSLRSNFPSAFLDCHLMIEKPEVWVERICRAGASSVTFHLEATTDPVALAQRIKDQKVLVGVAIKPETPIKALGSELLEIVDMVLVMTVEPGFGGQKLIPACIQKVKELRSVFGKLIQVDGGVDESNASVLKAAGANVLVAGSSIFQSKDPKKTINSLRTV